MRQLQRCLAPPFLGAFTAFFVALLLLGACSDDTTHSPDGGTPDGSIADGSIADGKANTETAPFALVGTVTDDLGQPVEGAKLTLGGKNAFSAADGSYKLLDPPTGSGTLTVTHDWFKEKKDVAVTVAAAGLTTLDISIEPWPFKLDPADEALANTYNQTFDWKKDTLALTIVSAPTRQAVDVALYYQNPALYRDTSAEAIVDSGLTLSNFEGKFVTSSGTQTGTDVLVPSSVKDVLTDTPLTAGEAQTFSLMRPLFSWLTSWDATTTKIADLSAAKGAVEQAVWGGSASSPQHLRKIYLHNGELWAELVFEPFVTVDASISDSDGDGYKEVYGKIDPKLYSTELTAALKASYVEQRYDVNAMSRQASAALSDLYTSTAASIEKYIAQPYTLPGGQGTINYPFIVIKHSPSATAVYQVLLLAP